MTKLEVDKEYWFKGKVAYYDEKYTHLPYQVELFGTKMWVPKENEAVEVIPDREKVTIPKFVADKIKYLKGTGEYGLFHAMDYCFQYKDTADWLERNEETFAHAWFIGYEVKKEKLYTVEIPNPNRKGNNRIYLGKADNTGKVFINKGTFNPQKNKSLWLTESEIKEDFEWAWQFAEPVEEE